MRRKNEHIERRYSSGVQMSNHVSKRTRRPLSTWIFSAENVTHQYVNEVIKWQFGRIWKETQHRL